MAGQLINVTRSITTITSPSGAVEWQAGAEALDVLGYAGARFDFSLKVFSFAGTSATFRLYTSMYPDDNNGTWSELVVFTAVTAGNVAEMKSVSTEVARYVKWHITYTSVTLVSFEILGVAW